ncbi:hypothetical protein [Streptomyces sp. NPDC001530]|uniref:hypothetical protein n=1 Tax=Streptomyces sp. NPDC001530 TaxID=3364582 RepID=UPI0036A9C1ED
MISGSGGGQDGGREFTADSLEAVLREACRTAELDPDGAELLRLGSNAVYRLSASPVIVRVARDHDALEEMERAVRVARWLEAEDLPATRVPAGVTQPLMVGGRVVTFWESVQEHEEYGTVGGAGRSAPSAALARRA